MCSHIFAWNVAQTPWLAIYFTICIFFHFIFQTDIVERDFLPQDEAPQALLKLSNSNINHSRHRLMEIAQ